MLTRRILAVDDELPVLTLLKRCIERMSTPEASYEVVTASSYDEAMQRYKETRDKGWDLILTDIVLKETRSGLDFRREIHLDNPRANIVAFTGSPRNVHDEEKKFFRDVYVKSGDTELLKRKVREYTQSE